MKNTSGCLFNFLLLFGFLGYQIGGIPGVIIGLLLAVLIDRSFSVKKPSYSNLIDEKVLEALTQLSYLVMKADDRVLRSELYAFRDFMLQNFGSKATEDAIEIMQYLQYQKISSLKATQIINAKLNYSEKMHILQFLFRLAGSDGEIHASEYAVLSQIAQEMQIRQADFVHLKNIYDNLYNKRYYQQSSSNQNQYSSSVKKNNPAESDYAILGMKSTDSNEDIKAAYRRLAMANHPDKVQHLGETAHSEAEKRFSKINEAYNRIKKVRKL